MQQIRVLLASQPGMLRDIVEGAVAAESDMTVVRRLDEIDTSVARLAAVVDAASPRERPDVIIVERADQGSLPQFDGLLFDHPRLAVIAITRDGRDARLRVLRPYEEILDNVSPNTLVAAIRESRRPETR